MMTESDSSSAQKKKILRVGLQKKRLALVSEIYEAFSRRACQHILASEVWARARTVALYCPVSNEVDTWLLLEAAWSGDVPKTVLLPVCVNRSGDMYFSPCQGPHELEPGAFGILAPAPKAGTGHAPGAPVAGETVEISTPVPDLIIVPLLGFGPEGGRLGCGGGYYDRMFARPDCAHATRLGLAFSMQRLDELPREPWDIPLQGICTEEGIQWFR